MSATISTSSSSVTVTSPTQVIAKATAPVEVLVTATKPTVINVTAVLNNRSLR